MTPTFHEFYKVQETVNEYGLGGKIVGYFRVGVDAARAAKGRGYWGSEGSIIPVPIIQIGSQFYELAQREAVTIDVDLIKTEHDRQAAVLAKLTPEDLAVLKQLGLREP